MTDCPLYDAHYEAHRWVEHFESPGGDPTGDYAMGPRYGALADQAKMAKAVTLYDSAIDAVTGDLYLLDQGEQGQKRTLDSIRETLDRLGRQKREAGLR